MANLIDPSGNESTKSFPCFEHPTLPDLLDAKHLNWRYYSVADNWNELWNAPSAIRHLRFGSAWSKVMAQNKQVLKDIENGQLPAVSWVIPNGPSSDHPGATDGSGPSWVAAIVNAIGTSPYWANTAILITWDEWGGFYDHVAPPIYNSYEYGFAYLFWLFLLTQERATSHMLRTISAVSSGSSKKPSVCVHSGTPIREPQPLQLLRF